MNVADLRSQTMDQLKEELIKFKKEQFNLRFQAASGQLEKTNRFKEIRRDIARVRTVMREKHLAEKAQE